jgi:hypothetical protein
MKKIGVFIILLLAIIITSVAVKADLLDLNPSTGTEEVLGLDPTDIPSSPEELKDQSSDYLKKEWNKILMNSTTFAPFTSFYKSNENWIDPLSRSLIGLEPSLSWLYVLALVLWGSITISIFRILSFLESISLILKKIIGFGGPWLKFIVSVGLIWFISAIGFTGFLAQYIISLIETVEPWWGQLITIIAVILILIIYDSFSAEIEKFFTALKEQIWKRQTDIKIKENKKTAKEIKEEKGLGENREKINKATGYAEAINEGIEEEID